MSTKLDKQRAVSIVVALRGTYDENHNSFGSLSPADVGMTPAEFGRGLALLFACGAITAISSGDVAGNAVDLVIGEGGR